jgi:hypothetical protein
MKQETLEEAAELYLENVNTKVHKDLERDGWMKIGFIGGAKWQQEQDKNKFSDEDMKLAFFSGCQSERTIKPRVKCWEEFIEQFKNK